MSIIDKFSAVEIKAENRISDGDKAFCAKQQEAFDKSGPALNRIAEAILAAKTEQQSILGSDDSKDSYLSPWGVYISCDGFKCDEDRAYEMMQKRNERFIKAIVDYFSRKYTVELDAPKILNHLIPTSPQEPKLPRGGYHEMSDEEIDSFKARMEAYRQEAEKHDTALRTLPLPDLHIS